MIFQDRQGSNLTRKKIKIISQTPNEIIADIERADNATIEGTQVNALVLNQFQSEINTANNNASSAVTTAGQANTAASTATENSQNAVSTSTSANSKADSAVITANNANSKADSAVTTANSANAIANEAKATANSALTNANTATSTANFAVQTANNASTNATSALNNSEDAVTASTNAINTANTSLTNSQQAITDSAYAKNKAEEVEAALADRGATITFDGVTQMNVAFESEPQTQISSKLQKDFSTLSQKNVLSDSDVFVLQDSTDASNPKLNVKAFWSAIKSQMLNVSYPIGSIFMSVNSTNPQSLFGGTWEAWGSGRVPVGINTADTDFASVEQQGGNKNLQAHTHANSVSASQASHNHALVSQDNWTGNCVGLKHSNKYYAVAALDGNPGYNRGYCWNNLVGDAWVNSATPDVSASITNATTGFGNSQNLQPYITCYMWKRIS